MVRVHDIMTSDVHVLSPETTVRDAMEFLTKNHISGAPVVSGRAVVGVVTTGDLLGFAGQIGGVPSQRESSEEPGEWEEEPDEFEGEDDASGTYFTEMWDDAGAGVTERMTEIEGPEWNALEDHDVSEVMTRDLWTLPSVATAAEAAEMMQVHGIHRVIVVDGQDLVGIVTSLDITRAVAAGKFSAKTYIFNRDEDFRNGANGV